MLNWRPALRAVAPDCHPTPFVWISDKYKAIYFENPKACSVTTKEILKTHCPRTIRYGDNLGAYNFGRFNVISTGTPPAAFEERFKDYFKFGFVRNPYDRFVSAYKMCIRDSKKDTSYTTALGWYNKKLAKRYSCDNSKNFKEYFNKTIFIRRNNFIRGTANHHWAPQIHFVPSDRVKLDFVGRFENFEEDFRFVLDKIGFRHDGEIPKLNATKSSNYMDYFDHIDEEKMSFFYDHYYEDFENFNYKRSLEC